MLRKNWKKLTYTKINERVECEVYVVILIWIALFVLLRWQDNRLKPLNKYFIPFLINFEIASEFMMINS